VLAAKLAEVSVYLVRSELQASLPAALALVQGQRGDFQVTLERPAEYFIAEKKQILRLPAIFLIPDNIDFHLEKGPNHPNAILNMRLSIVTEDRNEDNLTIKSYRYQSAIYDVLNGAQLTDTSNNLTLIVKVMQVNFYPIYSAHDDTTVKGVFRKEVSLTLEINYFENLNG
jgi:hypothetical protein